MCGIMCTKYITVGAGDRPRPCNPFRAYGPQPYTYTFRHTGKLVEMTGFEPAAPYIRSKCSAQTELHLDIRTDDRIRTCR